MVKKTLVKIKFGEESFGDNKFGDVIPVTEYGRIGKLVCPTSGEKPW